MSKLATFRIDDTLWQQFQDLAKSKGTSASALLVAYIQQSIDGTGPERIDAVEASDPKNRIYDFEAISSLIDERIEPIRRELEAMDQRLGKLNAA